MAWRRLSNLILLTFLKASKRSTFPSSSHCYYYYMLARMNSSAETPISPSKMINSNTITPICSVDHDKIEDKMADSDIQTNDNQSPQSLSDSHLEPLQNSSEPPLHDPSSPNQTTITNPTTDRYVYSHRGFTSEIFKIEIINLPPYVGFKQVRTRLVSLKLDPVKVKMSKTFCFVTFRTEEEKQEAMKVINGHVWKKKNLRAIPAKPAVDPIAKRKRKAANEEESGSKRVCEEPKDIPERLADAITPLLHLPYDEQLAIKTKTINDYLIKVAQSIGRLKPGAWFDQHVSSNNGLFCPLLPIKPSPVLTEYRNKCEFTIGLGIENQTVVGFRLGAYRHGDLTVAPPTSSCIVPDKTKEIVQIIQEVVSESSLKPFDCFRVDGHWKQLVVRHFMTGETMAIVQFHGQQLSEDIIQKEKQSLITAFINNGNMLTSLYWQTLQERMAAKEKTSCELLIGQEYIHEELLGARFRVSPDAFFQINTRAAEVLYRTIGELITNDDEKAPVIYDLCCGTGTIGISLLKNADFSKLIGIELSSQAVDDAIHNATANGIKNAEFVCGKVENTLSTIITKQDQSIIAIADPPRGGLHQRVIQAIRKCASINTLIYVSCNPEGTINNFTDLCRPKSNRLRGDPFCPIKAVPIDLFPHTRHCELIVVFKRIQPSTSLATNDDIIEKDRINETEMKLI